MASTSSIRGVLIVGAGPTGLTLALWLTRLGVPVRIIDQAAEPGTTSRALAVQGRTLEFYRQVGLADAAVERGQRVGAFNMWASGRRRARAAFGALGEGLSPYPYALIYPQDEHERLLIERLATLGVEVERRCELLSFEEPAGYVIARLKRPNGTLETCEASYLAGCDGAHSTVRNALGIGFGGGTYAHLFYVADVQASGAMLNDELHGAFDKSDFLIVFPLKARGHVRLVGAVRGDAEHSSDKLSWEDVSRSVMSWLPIELERVNWFSTYRVHHRVAEQFRKGRAFLLGDAAHIHSPVGGQGMNTGIGDAVNLAWKLAAALLGRAADTLLDSYESERIAFARRLVDTTDRAFTAVTSSSWTARFLRLQLFPLLLPIMFRTAAARRLLFRTVSQISVNYRGGPLSEGCAGAVHGGDRLPWVPASGPSDNFTPLASLAWQVHVYGEASPLLKSACAERGLPLHVFAWRAPIAPTGIKRNAGYLVRPDGYVALADPLGEPRTLGAYLDARNLTP
jgi:2-polyprenyl-6-methoxyphenol hydroxylase-like FAD-dependent oxidoreductase